MPSKPLILIIVVLLSFTLLFGYLSYNFYGKKVEAESSLRDMKGQMSALQDSYDKQEKACRIADSITTELQEESKVKEKDKQELLGKIDKIPAKPKAPIQETTKNEEVDIDAVLPLELRRMLQHSYDNLQRQGASDAG
ncbi:hypothetical protein D3C85_173290 [compost metagenome]